MRKRTDSLRAKTLLEKPEGGMESRGPLGEEPMEPITVLVVDDQPVVREGWQAMLGSVGDINVVGEASDGIQGIEKVGELRPRIVLIDLHTPNMDGLEVTRCIREQFPETTVILFATYDNDNLVVEAIRAGVGGYLLKDASKELLIHAIRAVNGGGILFNSNVLRRAMAEAVDSAKGPVEATSAQSGKEYETLTPRERDVLRLVVQGRTNRQIGQALVISEDTVKKHMRNIMAKLGVSDRTQAAVRAVRWDLVS